MRARTFRIGDGIPADGFLLDRVAAISRFMTKCAFRIDLNTAMFSLMNAMYLHRFHLRILRRWFAFSGPPLKHGRATCLPATTTTFGRIPPQDAKGDAQCVCGPESSRGA